LKALIQKFNEYYNINIDELKNEYNIEIKIERILVGTRYNYISDFPKNNFFISPEKNFLGKSPTVITVSWVHFSREMSAVISFVVDAGKCFNLGFFSKRVVPVFKSITVAELVSVQLPEHFTKIVPFTPAAFEAKETFPVPVIEMLEY